MMIQKITKSTILSYLSFRILVHYSAYPCKWKHPPGQNYDNQEEEEYQQYYLRHAMKDLMKMTKPR